MGRNQIDLRRFFRLGNGVLHTVLLVDLVFHAVFLSLQSLNFDFRRSRYRTLRAPRCSAYTKWSRRTGEKCRRQGWDCGPHFPTCSIQSIFGRNLPELETRVMPYAQSVSTAEWPKQLGIAANRLVRISPGCDTCFVPLLYRYCDPDGIAALRTMLLPVPIRHSSTTRLKCALVLTRSAMTISQRVTNHFMPG